tara:strand:- start:293 stop:811 length:519 start_codon:yes stop_codon:yes gene_type:complete
VNNKRISKGFWVWGQFDQDSTKTLTNLKKELDVLLNGPFFDIHITLCGPFQSFDTNARKKLKDISNVLSPINLLSEDVQIKQEFFQSLFIKIKEDKSLLNLKTKIDNQFTMPDKIFFPHISLYYGDKDKEKKTKAIKQLDKFNNTFLLEKLCLVEVDEEISSWRIIETYSLL